MTQTESSSRFTDIELDAEIDMVGKADLIKTDPDAVFYGIFHIVYRIIGEFRVYVIITEHICIIQKKNSHCGNSFFRLSVVVLDDEQFVDLLIEFFSFRVSDVFAFAGIFVYFNEILE